MSPQNSYLEILWEVDDGIRAEPTGIGLVVPLIKEP
jgi:hypothetical protein